jgi:hypothetical protein
VCKLIRFNLDRVYSFHYQDHGRDPFPRKTSKMNFL